MPRWEGPWILESQLRTRTMNRPSCPSTSPTSTGEITDMVRPRSCALADRRFLHESPFSGPIPIHGGFSFTSSLPVAALALRTYANERAETLVTTLPVVESAAVSQDVVTIPHFADGGGWTTRVVLLNTTDSEQSGRWSFSDRETMVRRRGRLR